MDNDLLYFIIKNAINAPSGHNTQPWLFKIEKNKIILIPDFSRALPIVDPNFRELFISLGCVIENINLAANHCGFETEVCMEHNQTIVINLIESVNYITDPLFSQIAKRQSCRNTYNGQRVDQQIINELLHSLCSPEIEINAYANNSDEYTIICDYIKQANILQMQDPTFKHELLSWIHFNKKQQNQTCDGISYAVFGAPNLPAFVAQFIMKKVLNPISQNKRDVKNIYSSSHLILFSTTENTLTQWLKLGQHLQRCLLKLTQLGIHHAYLNQPNEVPEIAKQLANRLGMAEKYPTLLLRVGYSKPMPFSKRRDIKNILVK